MAQQVNWGVLGAASIAVQRVIPAMRDAPSAIFLALASRDASKARAVACRIEIGDEQSVGALPTTVHDFAPANQYALQVERFSRRVPGATVPT